MINDDGPKSEEEQREEIKFEIKQIFDDLEFEIVDIVLKDQVDQQRAITINALSEIQKTPYTNLPEEVKNELVSYSKLLETAINHIQGQNEYTAAQIKIGIAKVKLHYESEGTGGIDDAYDILVDPEDPDGGLIVYADNVADWSEELETIYNKIVHLVELINSLRQQQT